MGHHRKGRPSRRQEGSHGAHRAADRVATTPHEPPPTPPPQSPPPNPPPPNPPPPETAPFQTARVETAGTPTTGRTAPAPRDGARRSATGGVGGRGLEELADAARTARRTGWPFGVEVLATVDTRGVPATTPPPRDGRPRRYATHQPTAPIETVTTD